MSDKFKPKEVFEWALSLQQNLEKPQGKDVHQSADERPGTATSTIHFQSDDEAEETIVAKDDVKIYRNVSQLQKAVNFQVTKNQQMLSDIMRRIWGEQFPGTFITEILEEGESSPVHSYRPRSRQKTPVPIRKVQDEVPPLLLSMQRCALPSNVKIPEVLKKVQTESSKEDIMLTMNS